MGTLEILNMAFNTIFGSIMTLWKNAQEDKKAEREHFLKTISEQRAESKDVREYEGISTTDQNRTTKKSRKWTLFGKEFGFEYNYDDSGKYKAHTGFHITRRFLAVTCILSIVVFPIIIPAFWNDIMFTYGYIENTWSLIPWIEEVPVIKWITVGTGDKSITLTPLASNIAIMIISLFFGNQITKKN